MSKREAGRQDRDKRRRRGSLSVVFLLTVLVWGVAGNLAAAVQTLRVVCYNIAADTNGYTTPRPGLYTVLEAIGENFIDGVPHPIDVLALQETTSNAATVAPIVTALNNYYGAGVYALVFFQGGQRGSANTGNGPSAMIYNTHTVQVVPQNGAPAAGVLGTPTSGSGGAPRQVLRYQFMPVGSGSGANFFVYVTHMKSSASGLAATNQASRNTEAQLIQADLANLPANGGVLAVGDFNMDGNFEAAYQTLTAPGAAQLLDPLNHDPQDNSQTWNTAAFLPILTESATSLHYRDDIQFMSPATLAGTSATGLRYVPGSHHAFGNNGTTPLYGNVNQPSNTALDGLQGPISASDARAALATASDHLPVVADYQVGFLSPYEAWARRYFTGAELTQNSVSGDQADPDDDGIVNLLEHALNLDPRQADAAGLPVLGVGGEGKRSYLTLTYTKVIAASDVTYTPQVSGDLIEWNGDAESVVIVGATDNADGLTQTVVARDATVTGRAGQRFMRLIITRP